MRDRLQNHILRCTELAVGYKGSAVLTDLNLTFKAGQFVSLLGPNGAGKTTLLRTLSRHLHPISGHIDLQGRALGQVSAMELARFMAVVLTDKVSPPLFTVYEFVALGRYPHTGYLGRLNGADHLAVQRALTAVHADDLAQRTFTDLSDGERQKALVARALAQQPQLLLLDEPTLHLDLKHRVEVMGILRNLCRSQKITVVASLHDVDVAAKVSDRVALINSGTVTHWGSPEAVLNNRTVAQLYDFNNAEFCHQLGGIEWRGDKFSGRAFVVAGMGSGAQVYRMLSKNGYAIVTGVLHTNDLDYYVARSLGADCRALSAMQAVNENDAAAAGRKMDDCDVVIDCGFEVGLLNQGNLELLRTALRKGKPVFTLGKRGGGRPEYESGCAVTRCGDIAQLMEAIDQHVVDQWPRQTEELLGT